MATASALLESKLSQQNETSSTHLDLSGTSIRHEREAKKVAHWINHNQPEVINLSGCAITSHILRVMSISLRKNAQLRELSLQNNDIDTAGCGVLSDILRTNVSIQSINILGNRICPPDTNADIASSQTVGMSGWKGIQDENAHTSTNAKLTQEEVDETEIQDFVETCNEMQNLRSVCGCTVVRSEITLSTEPAHNISTNHRNSNILLLGIELKLGAEAKSLQFCGSEGLSEICDTLRENRSIVRVKLCRFQQQQQSGPTECNFETPLKNFIEHNTTLRTLQLQFDAGEGTSAASVVPNAATTSLESGKSALLCAVRAMELNTGVTTLQLENWPRDYETLSAIGVLLRKNSNLLHLALFNTVLRIEDLQLICIALEYNKTLRVLSISHDVIKSLAAAKSATSTTTTTTITSSNKTLLLTSEMKDMLDAAARARKTAFIIRFVTVLRHALIVTLFATCGAFLPLNLFFALS